MAKKNRKQLQNNGRIHSPTRPIGSSYFVGDLGEDIKDVLADAVYLQISDYSTVRISGNIFF